MTAVDHDSRGLAMALKRLAQKPCGSGEVSPLAEPELDGVAIAVDGAVQVWELKEQLLQESC